MTDSLVWCALYWHHASGFLDFRVPERWYFEPLVLKAASSLFKSKGLCQAEKQPNWQAFTSAEQVHVIEDDKVKPHAWTAALSFCDHHPPTCLCSTFSAVIFKCKVTYSRCCGESCCSVVLPVRLIWADSNPMSHRRQQVATWLPQWHAAQSLTRLHNSVRPLLSHQPCFFIVTVMSAA